jgi:hypothetical protein
LLQGQEPRPELTLKDLGIADTSILHMQSSSAPSLENESIYRELSHVLSEDKKAESQWRCTKATSGVARSGLLQSMHDPNKGASDFSEFMKQRMGEVREFSPDWSKFNQALHRYKKIAGAMDLDSLGQAVAVAADANSYIRSVDNAAAADSNDHRRTTRVAAPQLKDMTSSHRAHKSKADQASTSIDRQKLLNEARNHQHLVKTDMMHRAQAQFLQQQMDNLQKIIVDKGPLEVDPAKTCKRIEIACSLPWDESLHRGYRESPEWLRKQRQTVDIPGEEKTEGSPVAKSRVPVEAAPKASVTVSFDIQEETRPGVDAGTACISPAKSVLSRRQHISDPTLNRYAMMDAAAISAALSAKYRGATLDFRPPPPDALPNMPSPAHHQHAAHTSPSERALGIRTPTRATVTKRGLSKDWRER